MSDIAIIKEVQVQGLLNRIETYSFTLGYYLCHHPQEPPTVYTPSQVIVSFLEDAQSSHTAADPEAQREE
ncbi:hypothetical protein PAAG_03469 [Paracoccidioides lutzii Pb01]|uniref:Uncharacterized protein n=1 Tax=Paracoccidioides lutzii (strain ATCC MYA-826 / Pb01) TaxID=502779 RepID=C1GX95_PARBA|nr:hypothetical protein PAAG_03469 [Paracoccidioides lutzii Pb01]EEH41183.2 hypothetical protein PAAG_03469 [Paracoccidioides lutzii Pb01]